MMENRTEKKRNINKIQELDTKNIELLIDAIGSIKDRGLITEDTVKALDSVISELLILRSKYSECLIQWLKQDYILDPE